MKVCGLCFGLEVQKQDNSIDCGLFAIANAVEFCNNGYKGGTHINYDGKYMRDHLIYCLERGFFSQFPKNHIGRAPKILKTKDHLIPINCNCGNPDTIEDMIGCDGKTGRKFCNVWRHKSCAGNIGNGAVAKSERGRLSGISWLVQSHLSRRWFGQPAAQTHPHLIKEGEVTPGITKDEYKKRRNNLMKIALQTHTNTNHMMIIPSATKQIMTSVIPYPFHQNTDFWYLCGFLEPDSLLVMQFNSEQSPNTALFVRKRDPDKEMWDGPRSGIEGALQLTGVDNAFNTDDLGDFLRGYLCDNREFVLWYNEKNIVNPIHQNGMIKDFIKEGKHSKIENVSTMLQALRVIKSPNEVELMRKSCDIAADAFKEVMRFSYPGVNEHYLYAKMDFECRVRDAEILAYPPVVAGGNRANTIHYVNNNQIIHGGEMVLMDAGCEYHGYVSDITRTWPVSGKYTDNQRCLYDIVLRIQKQCIEQCVPGQTMNKLYVYMLSLMGRELQNIGIIPQNCENVQEAAKPFCPHHVSHYLGMDVHDTLNVSCDESLLPGMVITVEPGIYLPDNNKDIPEEYRGIGIRIEDNILITKSTPDVLSSAVPKDPDEIEKIIAGL